MADPLVPTLEALNPDDQLRSLEFLHIPNVLMDYQLNLNTRLQIERILALWDQVVGPLRLAGFHKTHRTAAQGRPAFGTIQVVGPALLPEGSYVEVPDGVQTLRFEFDTDNVVTPGHVRVDISAATSIDDVRDALGAAITASALNITTAPSKRLSPSAGSVGFGPGLDLFNTVEPTTWAVATLQNAPIVDTVPDERFTHTDMEGARPIHAVGRISFPPPTALADGQTFVLPGISGNPDQTIEFDTNATVTPGNIAADTSGITTETELATLLLGLINGVTGMTGITASIDMQYGRGWLTALDPALIQEGDTFTIGTTTFEYDRDASVLGTNTPIDISAALTMQDVRLTTLTTISAHEALAVTATSRGFGPRIDLVSDVEGVAGNLPITAIMSSIQFRSASLTGGAGSLHLVQANTGSAFNLDITHTVQDPNFTTEGMHQAPGDGWDVTPGVVAFKGYTVHVGDLDRLPAVAGEQSFLVVRATERRLTNVSDPDLINVNVPGINGSLSGANQVRWSSEILIESINAPAPTLTGLETEIHSARFAEFDDTTGTTIVPGSEIEVRATRFGQFQEPQDASTKVDRIGDTMTGDLMPSVTGLNLGTALQRWDAFLEDVTFSRVLTDVLPDVTGTRSLGSYPFRWNAILNNMEVASITGDLIPSSNIPGDHSLGSALNRWDAFINELTLAAVVGNLVPLTTNPANHTLGTATNRWRAFVENVNASGSVQTGPDAPGFADAVLDRRVQYTRMNGGEPHAATTLDAYVPALQANFNVPFRTFWVQYPDPVRGYLRCAYWLVQNATWNDSTGNWDKVITARPAYAWEFAPDPITYTSGTTLGSTGPNSDAGIMLYKIPSNGVQANRTWIPTLRMSSRGVEFLSPNQAGFGQQPNYQAGVPDPVVGFRDVLRPELQVRAWGRIQASSTNVVPTEGQGILSTTDIGARIRVTLAEAFNAGADYTVMLMNSSGPYNRIPFIFAKTATYFDIEVVSDAGTPLDTTGVSTNDITFLVLGKYK